MKHLLLIILLFLGFNASAQNASCAVPAYFPRLAHLLGKGLKEALAEASTSQMQHIDSEWSAESGYLFKLHLQAQNQRIELVFIEGQCDTIWLGGDSCICAAEEEYVKKWWVWSGNRNCYTNQKKTYEVCLMQDSQWGCIAFALP